MALKYRLALFLLLLIMGIVVTGIDLLILFPSRPGPGTGEKRIFEIPHGVGPKGLTSLLDENGLLSSPGRFSLWLRLTGGLAGVKAGEFHIEDNCSAVEILTIISGRPEGKGMKVVIPEGFNLRQMGAALQQAGVLDAQSFITAATDPSLVKERGMPGPTFEGYLFPDTYYFDQNADAVEIITTMNTAFLITLEQLGIPHNEALMSLVALASIVQAETGITDEMPIIAGVYTNRLTKPEHPSRLLQADPTVAYGCETYISPRAPSCKSTRGPLTRSQLDDSQNPYNTYQNPGLPPGPICAPGKEALAAAFTPKAVPYLFFVADPGSKGHRFSATLAEHQEAVRAYRNGK